MAKEKPTLFRLSKQLDAARRHYAAGDTTKAEAFLRMFKDGAKEVLTDQQQQMVREMNHHLTLRNQLKELTAEAKALSVEVKGGTPDDPVAWDDNALPGGGNETPK